MGLPGFTLISGVAWAPTSNTGFPGLNLVETIFSSVFFVQKGSVNR